MSSALDPSELLKFVLRVQYAKVAWEPVIPFDQAIVTPPKSEATMDSVRARSAVSDGVYAVFRLPLASIVRMVIALVWFVVFESTHATAQTLPAFTMHGAILAGITSEITGDKRFGLPHSGAPSRSNL